MDYGILDCLRSSYNGLIGWPALNQFKVTVSTYSLTLEPCTAIGLFAIRGDRGIRRECFLAAHTEVEQDTTNIARFEEGESCKKLGGIQIIRCGCGSPRSTSQDRQNIAGTHQKHCSSDAHWDPGYFFLDAIRFDTISPDTVVHRLEIPEGVQLTIQNKRTFTREREQVIRDSVNKLLEGGIVKRIDYPVWLANPVVILKHNGEWQMCIDYTDLNRAIPKKPFPLHRINTNGGCHCGWWSFLLFGCMQGLPLDTDSTRRHGENNIRDWWWYFLLH